MPLSEPTDFQSVPIDQLWHLTILGGECGNRTHSPISGRQISNLLHYHPAHSPVDLEQRVRFELTVEGVCNPLHWTTLPSLYIFGAPQGIRTPIPQLRRLVHYPVMLRTQIGGSGEIRTHGAISDPLLFKSSAINRTLPHLHLPY